MIQAILNFFGLGKKDEPVVDEAISRPIQATVSAHVIRPVAPRPAPPARPPLKKTSVRANNYYRRRGKYYSVSDDSLIDDLILLVVLDELFADGDINEVLWRHDDNVADEAAEPVEDLLDIDVSDTPVVTLDTVSTPEPAYVAPEPTPEPEPVRESVSSGSSYSSSSSDYDSGGSDDGGSDE